MRKYFLGLLGSLFHIIGIIFICSSLYFLLKNYWGYVLFILGFLALGLDWYNLRIFLAKIEKKYKNYLIILDILTFIFFLIVWFIEVPQIKEESTSFWSHLKTFFIFLFLLCIFINFIYRNIIGYHLYNLMFQKSLISINFKKILLQPLILLLILILINLVFVKWDITIDLTPGYYSFSTRAQEIIRSIKNQNIKIFVFLPDQQLVQTKKDTTVSELYNFSEELKIMFGNISKINSEIHVEFYNADLLEINNQSFGNVANGTIILRNYINTNSNIPYTERRIYVFSNNDLEKLEQNFIRSLLQIASDPVKVYFSTSFGERYTSIQKKPYNLDFFIDVLRIYNFEISEWNENNGFPNKLPEDAHILVLAGPQNVISRDVRKMFIDFIINKKGKVLCFIDPESKEDFNWLLEELKIPYRFKKGNLLQIENKPNFIYTDQIGITDLTQNIRNLEKPKILFTGNGYFIQNNEDKTQTLDFKIKEILYTSFNTWEDLNNNLKKDPQEKNQRFILGLQIEKEDSRLVVYSGIDWITNKYLIQNIYNQNLLLATDSLFYLSNRMNIPGILEEKRENQNILIDENGKIRLLLVGIIGIPLLMILLVGVTIYYYNKKYKIQII